MLFGSSLARNLTLAFAGLALIESVFFGVICAQIIDAEKLANKELRLVEASESLTKASMAAVHMWSNRADAIYTYKRNESLAKYDSYKADLRKYANVGARQLESIGIEKSRMARLRARVEELIKTADDTLNVPPEKSEEREDAYQDAGSSCATCLLQEMRHIHKIASKRHYASVEQTKDSPITLLYIALAANVVWILLIAFLVESRVIAPIKKLASGCEQIKQKKVLKFERAPSASSEIAALQTAFHDMSVLIAEEEQRRTNYQELFQEVQTTALVKVSRYVEKLGVSERLSALAHKRLTSIGKNISTVISLLHSMTEDLNQPFEGQMKLKFTVCSSGKLVQDCLASVDALLQKRRISVVVESIETELSLDNVLIGRVLTNLISNAIKYSADGGQIVLSVGRTDEAEIRFAVRDFGPGISAQDQSKLFKKFAQTKAADGTSRDGTGLGLKISKEIIESHGGKIGCDSAPGEGSCFWFTLPLARIASTNTSDTHTKQPSAGTQRSGSIKTKLMAVLFVFLAIQACVFVYLQNRLSESALRAPQLVKEKETLLDTEELFALFYAWGKATDVAIRKSDAFAAVKVVPMLDEQCKKSEYILSELEFGSPLQAELRIILQELQYLRTLAHYSMMHLDELKNNLQSLSEQARSRSYRIEVSLLRMLEIEEQKFQVSFRWSQKIRSEIVLVLILAAAVDLIVVLAASVIGLRIAGRIDLLKNKAGKLALGQELTQSFQGNDELSFLDNRLCAAAATVRESKLRKQELMAVISHDLRTPLTSILGGLELISQGVTGQLDEIDSELAKESELELKKILSQINDLLLIEKIDSGTFELELERVSVCDFINESVKSQESALVAKAIQCEQQLNLCRELSVCASTKLLARLFDIVLNNAIQATPEKGVISITCARAESNVVIDFADTGAGIDASLLAHVFERFRVVNGKPLAGLGMPLALRICRLHSGSISIKSSGIRGTIVEIELPLV